MRVCAGTLCLLTTIALAGVAVHAQGDADSSTGYAESWRVVRGEVHIVRLSLDAGQFVRGAIEQGEADVAIIVRDPAGAVVAEYDERHRGVELVSLLAATRGVYRVEVRTL